MIYDKESREYIKRVFGTDQIGNCKTCSESNNQVYGSDLKCGKKQCLMLTRLLMHQIESNHNRDSKEQAVLNKLYKLRMLNFEEEIIPPWLIMKQTKTDGTSLKYWFNLKSDTSVDKGYPDIKINGNMICCLSKGEKVATHYNAEVYSIYTGDKNLVEGIPRVIYNDTLMSGICSLFKKLDVFNLVTIDPDTGSRFGLIVNQHGKRLAYLLGDVSVYKSGENLIIDYFNTHKIIRADKDLNIINKSKGVIAFNI